jgi:hypothetical protein
MVERFVVKDLKDLWPSMIGNGQGETGDAGHIRGRDLENKGIHDGYLPKNKLGIGRRTLSAKFVCVLTRCCFVWV